MKRLVRLQYNSPVVLTFALLSLAALLLDNQVRAAEYLSAQLADILKSYVLPYGVTKRRAVRRVSSA